MADEETPPVEPVVTDRGPGDTPKVVKTTPLSWWVILLVRATRASLQSLIGSGTFIAIRDSQVIPSEPAAMILLRIFLTTFATSVLWNGLELLKGWDTTHPELRG